MQLSNLKIIELQADLYATMSNPKRLMIVDVLSHGEKSVGSIAEILELAISGVSQHLRVMRDKGLVITRRDGQTIYYRLTDPKITDCCHAMRSILLEQIKAAGQLAENVDFDNITEDAE